MDGLLADYIGGVYNGFSSYGKEKWVDVFDVNFIILFRFQVAAALGLSFFPQSQMFVDKVSLAFRD